MRSGAVALAALCVAAAVCAAAAAPIPFFGLSTERSERLETLAATTVEELERAVTAVFNPLRGRAAVDFAPELVVLMVAPGVEAHHLAQYAHDAEQHAFGSLKSALASAASTVSGFLDVEHAGAVAQAVRSAIVPAVQRAGGAVRYLAATGNALADARSLQTLATSLQQSDLNRDVPSLVVLHAPAVTGSSSAWRESDKLFGKLLESVRGRRVMALVVADALQTTAEPSAMGARTTLSIVGASNASNTTTYYMSVPIVMGLLTSALALLGALVGFLCLFYMQGPSRFELPEKNSMSAAH